MNNKMMETKMHAEDPASVWKDRYEALPTLGPRAGWFKKRMLAGRPLRWHLRQTSVPSKFVVFFALFILNYIH